MEIYAREIFSRVYEIDNAFKNIALAFEYLGKNSFEGSSYNFSEHYAFHIENFLLRLTSVIDRSYLLAGSTMLMENTKIERLGGNRLIHKKLEDFSPEAAETLKKMEEQVASLRQSRNTVAHQAGFSSKNLSLIQTVENVNAEMSKSLTDIMPLDDMKKETRDEVLLPFKNIVTSIDKSVEDLLNSLSFVYTDLLEST